jgi:hypothetical protein
MTVPSISDPFNYQARHLQLLEWIAQQIDGGGLGGGATAADIQAAIDTAADIEAIKTSLTTIAARTGYTSSAKTYGQEYTGNFTLSVTNPSSARLITFSYANDTNYSTARCDINIDGYEFARLAPGQTIQIPIPIQLTSIGGIFTGASSPVLYLSIFRDAS